MSWQKLIQPGSVWTGVEAYADERIAELSAVCCNPTSSDAEIRQAQAGIAEMNKLKSLPDRLRTNAEITKAGTGRRREY